MLRVVDSLQLYDKHHLETPEGWKPGDKVFLPKTVSSDEAKRLGAEVQAVPYLRTMAYPSAS